MHLENVSAAKTIEAEINLDKRYKFPSQLFLKKWNETYLVIYTEGVNWIVLNNETELSVFQYLQDEHSISEALETYDEESVVNVLRQIEARRFENPRSSRRHGHNIYLLLTNRCNQRCRHCYMFAGERDYDELSVSQWKDVLKQFRRNGGMGTVFSGGEITVYDGYSELIEYAHNIGLSVTVLSNGTQWTEKTISELHSFIDEIQISVDGYDAASYFKIRQHDGFERALESIRLFYAAGTKVSIAVTPLYDDLDTFLNAFEKFARDLHEEYPNVFIKFNYELIAGRDVSLSSMENSEYKNKIKGLIERLYPGYHEEIFALNYEDRASRSNCGFGEISVAPNGDVFWCNRISELTPAANVLEDSFETIMALSEKVKTETSVDNTYPCQDCDIRYICGGGCRLEYEGIQEIDTHTGKWTFRCSEKDDIYKKMILSNEYFFEG